MRKILIFVSDPLVDFCTPDGCFGQAYGSSDITLIGDSLQRLQTVIENTSDPNFHFALVISIYKENQVR